MRSAIVSSIVFGALVAAADASAACLSYGTQIECDLGLGRVVLGTQTAAEPRHARSVQPLSLLGNGRVVDEPPPPSRFHVQLQDVGRDPTLCRTFGNETYCE